MPQTLIDATYIGPPASPEFQRTSVAIAAAFALPTSAADAKLFSFLGCSGGMMWVSAACTITWYVAESVNKDTTVAAAYDYTGAAITQTVAAAGWYEIPPSLFGAIALAPVASGAANAKILLKK